MCRDALFCFHDGANLRFCRADFAGSSRSLHQAHLRARAARPRCWSAVRVSGDFHQVNVNPVQAVLLLCVSYAGIFPFALRVMTYFLPIHPVRC